MSDAEWAGMSRALLFAGLISVILGCSERASDGPQSHPDGADNAVPAATLPEPAATVETTGIASVFTPPRRNKFFQLSVTQAGFDPVAPAAPKGQRHFTVGLRGTSVSRTAKFELDVQSLVFAQNEDGCISRVDRGAGWLKRPLGLAPVFSAPDPIEGQLSFAVPDGTERIRLLITSASGDSLIVPAGEDFEPAWPAPLQTIKDGSTLQVLVLPRPAGLPVHEATGGRELLVLDFVIENLNPSQGIEFTTSQQLRLVDASGSFIQPSNLTEQLGCRLDDGDVIPAGHSRRFLVSYEIPAGAAMRLQYRGFEVDETIVELE